MAITKEMFFECLEEGLRAWERLEAVHNSMRHLLLSKGTLQEWEALGFIMTKEGVPSINNSRLRWELMRRRWKSLETNLVRQERLREERKSVVVVKEEVAVDMDIVRELEQHEVLNNLSWEEKQRLVTLVMGADLEGTQRRKYIAGMASKQQRLMEEKLAKGETNEQE